MRHQEDRIIAVQGKLSNLRVNGMEYDFIDSPVLRVGDIVSLVWIDEKPEIHIVQTFKTRPKDYRRICALTAAWIVCLGICNPLEPLSVLLLWHGTAAGLAVWFSILAIMPSEHQ